MWKFGRSEGCTLFCTYLWLLIMSFTILKMKLHINLLKYLPFPFSCYFTPSWSCLFDMSFPEIWPESFWFGDHMSAHQLGGSTAAKHRASVLHQISSEFKDFRGMEEGKVSFLLQVASGIKTWARFSVSFFEMKVLFWELNWVRLILWDIKVSGIPKHYSSSQKSNQDKPGSWPTN